MRKQVSSAYLGDLPKSISGINLAASAIQLVRHIHFSNYIQSFEKHNIITVFNTNTFVQSPITLCTELKLIKL